MKREILLSTLLLLASCSGIHSLVEVGDYPGKSLVYLVVEPYQNDYNLQIELVRDSPKPAPAPAPASKTQRQETSSRLTAAKDDTVRLELGKVRPDSSAPFLVLAALPKGKWKFTAIQHTWTKRCDSVLVFSTKRDSLLSFEAKDKSLLYLGHWSFDSSRFHLPEPKSAESPDSAWTYALSARDLLPDDHGYLARFYPRLAGVEAQNVMAGREFTNAHQGSYTRFWTRGVCQSANTYYYQPPIMPIYRY